MSSCNCETACGRQTAAAKKTVTIAVAGNPNSGKSTFINAAAGTRFHTGNWPGVTVEKKTASLEFGDVRVELVDLPGIYSLSPYSQDEIIARDFLLKSRPDAVINVLDSTNLERNLYLSVQLAELEIPLVLALNMSDEAAACGLQLNHEALGRAFAAKAVPTVASSGAGVRQALALAVEATQSGAASAPVRSYGEDIDAAALELRRSLHAALGQPWLALRLLEGDACALALAPASCAQTAAELSAEITCGRGTAVEDALALERHRAAAGIAAASAIKAGAEKPALTERLDAIALHRLWGLPLFFAAMWLLFKLTFDISTPFADWLGGLFEGPLAYWAKTALAAGGAPAWASELAATGVIAGVGGVLVFVPAIFTMMFFITLLEASGYMARAAFIMDRAMRAIGLHGRSFIPLLLGFGCNVPSVYASRTLENQRDRTLTVLLAPMMSCGARLPVYAVFAGALFRESAGTVIWSMYMLGMGAAVVSAFILRKTLLAGETPVFLMELPPYRLPSWRNLLAHTWEKGSHFLRRAGTYILGISIIVWFMLNMPWGVQDKKESWMGRAGQAVAPALKPLGFGNWEAGSALLTGLAAKEIVVGTMAQLYAPSSGEEEGQEPRSLAGDLAEAAKGLGGAFKDAAIGTFGALGAASLSGGEDDTTSLQKALAEKFTPLSAYAFMAFVLLYVPCIAVFAVIRDELGSWKWTFFSAGWQLAAAWLAAFLIYRGGLLLGLGG